MGGCLCLWKLYDDTSMQLVRISPSPAPRKMLRVIYFSYFISFHDLVEDILFVARRTFSYFLVSPVRLVKKNYANLRWEELVTTQQNNTEQNKKLVSRI